MDRARPSAQLRLLSDRPVAAGGQGDLLDRSLEAERLAALLRDSRDAAPYVFAVYADWGMGKTSLLELTGERLRQSPDIEVVWFNAWLASDGRALEMIVKSVLDRLDPNSLRRLARKLSADSPTMSWTRVLIRGLAGGVRLHHLVDGIWDQLALDARSRADTEKYLRSAIAGFTGTDGSGSRERTIVVFIDDLDRCSAETIREVAAALKQYLAVPGLVFVLGCDRSVVEGAMRLGSAEASDEVSGRRYLEKIIQASYAVPAPTDTQLDLLIAGYADAAGAASLFQGTLVEAVKLHTGRNPRRIKQLMNRLVTEYRLDPDWQSLGAEALFSAAMLQELYPDFSRLLSLSDDMDPLEEFTGYLAVLSAVKAAEAGSPAGVSPQEDRAIVCLERNGIAPASREGDGPVISRADLAALEAVLPESMPRLAHDKVFAGLVKALVGPAADQELRAKLRRRRLAANPVPAATAPAYEPADPAGEDFSKLTVLWLGRDAETDAAERAHLAAGGAAVVFVTGQDEARRAMARADFQVLITNLARDGAPNGGFDDIVELLRAGFRGRVVIYTGVLSPSRLEQAAAIGAMITNDPAKLFQFAAQTDVAARTAPIPQDLIGAKVLWFGPQENFPLRYHLLTRGADVLVAPSPDLACEIVRSQPVTAVIADPFPDWEVFALLPSVRSAAESGKPLPALVLADRFTRSELSRAAESGVETAETVAFAAHWLRELLHADAAALPSVILSAEERDQAADDLAALARDAQRRFDQNDLDYAEARWDAVQTLAFTIGDSAQAMRARAMKGRIALRKRRYALAVRRLNAALDEQAAHVLDSRLLNQLYADLAEAHAALGDPERAAEIRALIIPDTSGS